MKKPPEVTPKAKPDENNWTALSRELGVSRQSIARWRARPEAPEDPDPDAWRAYVSANGLGSASGDELKDLRAQLLREQIEREKRRNQIETRSVVTLEECSTAARRATTCWAAVLSAKLENEIPPRLLGLGIAELRAELRVVHDEIIDAFNEIFSREKPDNPPPIEK